MTLIFRWREHKRRRLKICLFKVNESRYEQRAVTPNLSTSQNLLKNIEKRWRLTHLIEKRFLINLLTINNTIYSDSLLLRVYILWANTRARCCSFTTRNMGLFVAIMNGFKLLVVNNCHKDLYLWCCWGSTTYKLYTCFTWDITCN